MRAVILGSDLMYDKSGRLVPIEINTNIGYSDLNRVESADEWLDLTGITKFVKEKKFKVVWMDYSSAFAVFFPDFKDRLVSAFGKDVQVKTITSDDDVVENADELYIRIRYSDEAFVDTFCRDKVAFLIAIQNSSTIAQEFLYKEDGKVKGTMNDFLDNGEDPNYIVKYRYPAYDSLEYPKYFKLKNLKEVYALAESLEDDYILMPCYLNVGKMYNGERFEVLRQWSLIVPDPDQVLKSIDMGSYTTLAGKLDRNQNVWNEKGELIQGRNNYSSKTWVKRVKDVLLDEGDLVLMGDGSWKAIEDIQKGDIVLSLDVPHSADVDIRKHTGDYNVDLEEFKQDSTYTTNEVILKSRTEGFQNLVHMTFEEDEEEWWDTENSSYPTLDKEDTTVQFKQVSDLKKGDKIYLVKLDPQKVDYIERTIKEVWVERIFETGYTLELNGSHLFISKSPESTAGYVSIEHNASCALTCSRCRTGLEVLCHESAAGEASNCFIKDCRCTCSSN